MPTQAALPVTSTLHPSTAQSTPAFGAGAAEPSSARNLDWFLAVVFRPSKHCWQ